MFHVSDFMTRSPITVTPDENISAVLDLMKFNKIHRVPVTDANDKLVGLITEGRIATDNTATSLSIYELNYLLSKTKVRTVMIKHPIAIHENALMEEAAQMLLDNDIGCLPVIDDENKVTGILTQNDIFKSFLDMLAWKQKGTRISVSVPEGVGVLEQLCKVFASKGISLNSLSVYELNDQNASILIKIPTNLDEEEITSALQDNGFTVLEFNEISE